MIRIGNFNIEDQKKVWIGLQSIYGIGKNIAYDLCSHFKLNKIGYIKDLTEDQKSNILKYIQQHLIVGEELKQQDATYRIAIQRSGCNRGLRFARGLKCRGQNQRCRQKHKGKKSSEKK